jgi:hypothetical protein
MMMISIITLKSAINIVIASVKMVNKNKREKTFVCKRTCDTFKYSDKDVIDVLIIRFSLFFCLCI